VVTDAPAERVRVEATIRGRVQGVGFRYFVLREALDLDLEGWVANGPDGTVRCVVEGPRGRVNVLVELLRTGPPGGRVDDVAIDVLAPTGRLGPFTVRSGTHPGD
jgi:acylphosphatase